MKQEALTVIAAEADPGRKVNLLREYLQAMTLRSLHESGAFTNLSFVGGTALRFLFNLPRFSEDLDFSLENARGYDLGRWMGKLERDLRFSGFDPSVAVKSEKVVASVWVRFGGLLQEAGLAVHPAQKLSIKLEIDTNPPTGAQTENRVVNRFFLMALRHHDLPCLMAGKIRALLTRPYAKGRDWYDLLWYRTRVPPVAPSLLFLQSALNQGAKGHSIDAEKWPDLLEGLIQRTDWKAIIQDVSPFLERPAERELLKPEFFERAIRETGI